MVVALLLLACGGSPSLDAPTDPPPPPVAEPAPLERRPTVYGTSFPACWLVERLGAERVDARCAAAAGADPRTFAPPAELVLDLQQADLIVTNGAGYEAWLAGAGLPPDRLVDTARDLTLLTAPGTTHQHGGGAVHRHDGQDPHTWADPRRYLAQAEVVRAELADLSPSDSAAFDAAYASLAEELGQLDRLFEVATAGAKGRAIASNHPSFGYLADRYGLTIAVFDVDPRQTPGADATAAITTWAAGKDRPLLLWEAAPAPEVLAALPTTLQHLTLDPLEQPPEGGRYHWLAQARANLAILTKQLDAHGH